MHAFLAAVSLRVVRNALPVRASAPASVVPSVFVCGVDAGGLARSVLHADVILRGVDVAVSRVNVMISDAIIRDIEAVSDAMCSL